jgi:hypothetical protein
MNISKINTTEEDLRQDWYQWCADNKGSKLEGLSFTKYLVMRLMQNNTITVTGKDVLKVITK